MDSSQSLGIYYAVRCLIQSLERFDHFPIVGNYCSLRVADRQVLQLIEDQIRAVDQRIDALLLVGGFAGSEYLKHRVEVRHVLCGSLLSIFSFILSVRSDSLARSELSLGHPMLTRRPFVVLPNMVLPKDLWFLV
jgi:hypothetical protein